jgi:hypothetical protein
MEGKPEKASVTQSPRKPPPFVSGSPYQSQNLLPFIGTFEDVQVEVGIGVGGVEPLRETSSSGPSEPRVGLDCPFCFLLLILPLPHLRRRLCFCA